ncbi:MAG: BTAD domain-containing putative transcriptional regulator [Spirochaetia bacterium]
MLCLFWLGPPRVEVEDLPVRLETRKVTALLAVLSLERRAQSREHLATLLWPEYDSRRAPANLRRALASLQASLGPGWLQADRETVALCGLGRIRVDFDDLIIRVRDARTHHPGAEDRLCAACEEKLEEAGALHKGDFLEGFNLKDCPEFDQWQMLKRDELLQEMSYAMERLAQASAEAGRWEDAIERARRWLSLDELHEPAHRALMFSYSRTGKRSAALHQYEECARLLQAELGQEPDERTRVLYERIRDRKLERSVAATSPLRPAGTTSAPLPEATKAAAPFADLLRTKLDIPQLRAAGVERPRLLDVMTQGISHGLAVVSAPAGFGKSTFLSQWSSHADMPVAWLSLDSGDNDVHRFMLYCAGALDAAKPGLGRAAADLLSAMPPVPAKVVMTCLINAVSSAGGDIALVLDDYQFIRTVEIHEAVRLLVDRRPPLLRLVIATREDPPLPLARLRSSGALTEIRADDVRFTMSEAGLFLNSSMSLLLSGANVARLSKRTEGWIAGLQMAALSLQGRGDADAFISAFGGTNRYILDYLAEEVFSRQEEETRRFLLETSILDRMSAGLCEAVSGRRGGQEMLERLDRANLFVVALDERRCWFRYHHLFGDILLHWLERDRPPEEIRALRLRAGDWLDANGELAEAIQQYLAAGEFDRAAGLIERSYVEVLSRGGLGELLQWCTQFPDDITRQRPTFEVVAAWALAFAGKREAAETVLACVDSALDRSASGRDDAKIRALQGDVAIMSAHLNDLAGNGTRAIELARAADRLLPADHLTGRSLVLFILGSAFMYQGDLENSERMFSDRLRFSIAMDNIWSISNAVFWLLVLRRHEGTFDGCEEMLREYEAHVDRHHSRGGGHLAKTSAVAGELKREQGRLVEAERIVAEAVRQVEGCDMPSEVYFCLYYLARTQRSLGRVDEAVATVERAEEIARTSTVLPAMRTAFEVERVKNWLAIGDIESATAWADRRQHSEKESPLYRHLELVCLARVRLAATASNGGRDQALGLLEELTATARLHRWNGVLIESLLLLAKAKLLQFGPQVALSTMDEAVRLAYEGGFFQTVVEEGSQAGELLRGGMDAMTWTDPPLQTYVANVLGAAWGLPTEPREGGHVIRTHGKGKGNRH